MVAKKPSSHVDLFRIGILFLPFFDVIAIDVMCCCCLHVSLFTIMCLEKDCNNRN